MSKPEVKTDEKKQHFDDIYVAETPVPYKERILDALEYVSDNFNRQTFDRLILPWAQQKAADGSPLNFVDLAGCFGNTTMATLNGMDYDAIRNNWRSEEAAKTVDQPRRFPAHTTGIDISANALAYGKSAGLYDETIEADLNAPAPETRKAVDAALENADILISTAALVYLEPEAVAELLDAFARGSGEGYMLVNFLNPFAPDQADATKRQLLERFEFVGSGASRHRKLSPLEQENYPGEEWSLLEIWVLRRKS
ncbi:class I SAM-dependent methyltransferase [Thiohalorhabdus methylotrophus]|uniref:Class I SAM-dependent methyltransferase n=1 Tax=Thiohalorhabdus methylotrophus TaxID=3242694 RepID=A0ABV4U161_9GAMM